MILMLAKKTMHFRNNVFYVLLDCVIGNMTNRSESIYMHWSPCLVSYAVQAYELHPTVSSAALDLQ